MAVISSYSDVYGPRILLEADGALAKDIIPFITKFVYEDDETKMDSIHFVVANPGLKFRDDKRFAEGAKFRVRFGYLTDISDMKHAVVAKARPTYPQSGVPSIEMVAFNVSKDMNKAAKPVNYGNVSSTEVARRVARQYNFELEVEDSKDARREMRVQPAGVTDYQYLISLANKLNWDCYVEGTKLHFHSKRFGAAPSATLVYFTDDRSTLLKFQPEVDLAKPTAASVSSANPKDGDHATGGRDANGNPKLKAAFDFRTGTFLGLKAVETLSGPSPETSPKVTSLHGAAQQQKIDMNALKATGSAIGTPKIAARKVIRIEGVDKIYAGNWRVSKSTHTIDSSGYSLSFSLKKDTGKKSDSSSKKSDDSKNKGDGDEATKLKVAFDFRTSTSLGKVLSR